MNTGLSATPPNASVNIWVTTKVQILEMDTGRVCLYLDHLLDVPALMKPLAENETAVIRWNYGDPQLGSCKETIEGGSHFRYWVQDGKEANR